MGEREEVFKAICSRIEREARINARGSPIELDFDGKTLIVRGTVEGIAAKRRVFRIAEEVYGGPVADRIDVAPAEHREEGAILDALCLVFLEEPVFRSFSFAVWDKGRLQWLRNIERPDGIVDGKRDGFLEVRVHDGTVILEGEVWSVSHRRLAELLAWWTPGSTNVINRLRVVPAEGDNDDEISDAVRLAFEKDPLVDASQIKVTTRDGVVTLEGLVNQPEEARMAEYDVWYLGGVRNVENRIGVLRPNP